jgi:hypothetical protein
MATPGKKVTNQAQIAAAQQQNAAAQAKIVEAQAKAAAADAARKPVLKQTVAGIAGINKATQAAMAVINNPKSSQAQINKALADAKTASAAQKTNLASITPEQRTMAIEQGQVYTQAMSDVDRYNAMIVNVPSAIYEDEKQKSANVAYDTIGKILESYRITGLASVLETIRDEYPEASSEDILTLLQFDSRYNAKFNERFAANADRLKAGKPVLSPGEYLKLEQGYIKVFNAYNLPTFNTQAYYDTFIKNDLDIEEVTDRVQLGYDRVLNDQAVQSTFNKFFSSLGFNDIVAGMLDTTNQLPALERKVKAAEIGGAALRQGLIASELAATEDQANVGYTNVTRGTVGADVLGRQGVTKAQAETAYKNIAQMLPTAEKLSSIYGGTEEQYGRLEAEQEQLQGLASAARKRQRLTELETAQFRKESGLAKGALSSITNV